MVGRSNKAILRITLSAIYLTLASNATSLIMYVSYVFVLVFIRSSVFILTLCHWRGKWCDDDAETMFCSCSSCQTASFSCHHVDIVSISHAAILHCSLLTNNVKYNLLIVHAKYYPANAPLVCETMKRVKLFFTNLCLLCSAWWSRQQMMAATIMMSTTTSRPPAAPMMIHNTYVSRPPTFNESTSMSKHSDNAD